MAEAGLNSRTQDRFVPIRSEVITRSQELVAKATSLVFRPAQKNVHRAYAESFVAEVSKRLNKKPIPLPIREECLNRIVSYFVGAVNNYIGSTSLFREFGLMFEVIEVHLVEELGGSETESEYSSEEGSSKD